MSPALLMASGQRTGLALGPKAEMLELPLERKVLGASAPELTVLCSPGPRLAASTMHLVHCAPHVPYSSCTVHLVHHVARAPCASCTVCLMHHAPCAPPLCAQPSPAACCVCPGSKTLGCCRAGPAPGRQLVVGALPRPHFQEETGGAEPGLSAEAAHSPSWVSPWAAG